LFYSNVREGIELAQIKAIFDAFGTVTRCEFVPSTQAGESGSSGSTTAGKTTSLVVEFADAGVAGTTAKSLNNFDVAGLPLKCVIVSQSSGAKLLGASAQNHIGGSSGSSSSSSAMHKAVMLTNMVPWEDVNDPDLKDEISEEARNYGSLRDVEIIVDEAAQEVKVKLSYNSPEDATKAFKAMNGRVFAGNKIVAVMMS
jgi:hypothetical protein